MKSFFVLLVLLCSSLIVKSQCFQIESILVNACDPGSLNCNNAGVATCNCEGKNEMIRFKIGNAPLNVSNLSINWPNNSFQGISPVNATTTGYVNALNSTIINCGFLLQPVAGVLPANKRVLLITSTDFCSSANSFANLTDTLIIIFQNAGNYQGHFANTGSGTRTLSMSFSSPAGCSDAVTYNLALLTMQNGTIGNQDGAAVEFTPTGLATYVNYGCQAPFIPLSINAGPDKTICVGGTQSFTATPSGSYTSINWSLGSGATGSFSPTNSLTTTYTAGAGDNGTIKL